MTEPVLAYEARAAQEAVEYGTWRAVAPIFVDGVIGYQPGHAVPVSNVEAHGYDRQGLVERVDAARAEPEPQAPAPPQGQTIEMPSGPVDEDEPDDDEQ